MLQKLFTLGMFFFMYTCHAYAQEAFTISNYDININLNEDGSLDIVEIIEVHFSEERHGIIRSIPFRYPDQNFSKSQTNANRQLSSNGYDRIIIENIKVPGWKYKASNSGNNKEIKIGDADRYINGYQKFLISYRMLNAINFFEDHSELYFNVIGGEWSTTIQKVNFNVTLYDALSDTPTVFLATGIQGSTENKAIGKWLDGKRYSGTTSMLREHEQLTIGISFPSHFLKQQDYTWRGSGWVLLPIIVLGGMFFVWKKWGRDGKLTIQTEFYPPEGISPGVSGYLIDDKLNNRDLTALVPYWGAGGFLRIQENENESLFGWIKSKDYKFIKVKDLPSDAPIFEKTLFKGIFNSGDAVSLSSLKNVLYTTMYKAKQELEAEIRQDHYYMKYSKGMKKLFTLIGIMGAILGLTRLFTDWPENVWMGGSIMISALILIIFGRLMTKRSSKGNLLVQKLLGFKEFLKSVEKNRLEEFLKQDANYFDKILPYAIVFGIVDTWKDKLKGLEVPNPGWYSGHYSGNSFNTALFMNSLNHSLNTMTSTFYSAPSGSSAAGGGSYSSGGHSGGGFGGGGGSSW